VEFFAFMFWFHVEGELPETLLGVILISELYGVSVSAFLGR
jgi:hypothetical protein